MTAHQTQLDLGLENVGLDPVFSTEDEVLDREGLTSLPEPKGVVFTKKWVVDLILDLAGYRADQDLAALYAVEPAAGAGAFFLPMIGRLLDSLDLHKRPLSDARGAIHAYELDQRSAAHAIDLTAKELGHRGVNEGTARTIAEGWVTVGDFLLESRRDRRADLVVGNPPYIRYDDLPGRTLAVYRKLYPTMVGRCDIYIGFIEAGLRHLADGGALAFICADRWMRSAYGAQLRRLVANLYAMDVVIEMHNAPAFEDDVSAYPAVIVIRRAAQGPVLVANAGATAGPAGNGRPLADLLVDLADDRIKSLAGFSATRLEYWFGGHSPWPSVEPAKLTILQRLEERFHPLEDSTTGTRVGIGVATGNDGVYITTNGALVEEDRLLPLAMPADTRSGEMRWSGHYLVDPWQQGRGLVDLTAYPRLRTYFEAHRQELTLRNIAKRNARDWYRTIDRVSHDLT
ncbi:MAG TPA: Eco57I restriction-modification methylase domain-containing protein, partial [Acidimicrobiales bacterium]|nr:Eco57I restriction-modification methylase domain-containing protein [Acidimicrobiales bacterium]